ncbi:phosphoenolpyruvate synthase [bacterium (Candidatus Gribaldobacteria) CG_4_9_14_3_um_filter_36_15]|uniref:Phosphoenolpyruvate synthase n=4 Tax=Candidatus Gribaldobacteria TaxID=2798536 RepID=A0A2M7VK63_9BACT|nr:MAG: phosphoenolpyruvate synthase [Parcubacteria group bacterium CG2_30_36_21]PIR91022.1 MAG: phosphoenolpyruvate synthase [bacterium (Candidatus Gribaldobacteria) CG10_big_fil_rev_8_21_14_0_10_37_46]PIV14136.1 MAG: phosphoenolpyruvate synthase [bacterium (Candidatus Gribaldobacteria) CG03_land_8_20_14_0_80_36_40]PJA02049.1 MAG: phosphoenolpyruvate synthase [bacterium (Candidatus Gribaldobacteria) CG_4_10_14_0_2_um_filter_36_18]PJB09307.1 MAG: phosphoenolpyruvate synthase [bacterium (Candida
MIKKEKNILWFKEITIKDVPLVGGKNASLGEMYNQLSQKGIHPVKSRKAGIPPKTELFNRVNIPNGFAITAKAYFDFLKKGKIQKEIEKTLAQMNPHSIKNLQIVGKKIRTLILKTSIFKDLETEIIKNYRKLSQLYGEENVTVAVRSSATAEDLPSASFAGQHETYLNITGEAELLKAVRNCLSSLFLDRAISYREEKGFEHMKVGLSVGIQKMVRSDIGSAGVMFTLDTETGFPNIVVINGIFGLGEMIVKGKITPDEFLVFKPTLRQAQGKLYKPIIRKDLGRKVRKYIYSKKGGVKEAGVSQREQLRFCINDKDILTLAKWGLIIEDHYSQKNKKWTPQDIEWAKDGKTGELFVVQARPETVHSLDTSKFYQEYEIQTKKKPIVNGIAIGNKIGFGKVHIIENINKLSQFKKGEVLVTRMTDPDWTTAMPLASAIITDEGGKTCHAAIISRELGIPCIVGTGKATKVLKNGQEITIDCTSGAEGKIFLGKIPFEVKRYDLEKIFTPYRAEDSGAGPKLKTKIMINIGAPDIAFKTSFLPNDGVGLAREEFIIAEKIRVHPLALYHYKKLKAQSEKRKATAQNLKLIIKKIDEITVEHRDKREYFVKELAEGIAQIGAAFWPKPVIVRFSDFKTNEYRALVGGELFEPEEANPMLGWRGASRYYDPKFQPAFEMECRAIKRTREIFGLKNIWLMVPFCRTLEEGKKVLELMAKNGLKKGEDGLKVIVMCEIPSNVILAEEFLKIFDGMSIGSNDLTQLSLGIDRDNAYLQKIGDERDETIKKMISKVIRLCKMKNKYCGICGDAPSSFPDFAKFLVDCKIPSISLSPDAVIKTILSLSKNKK